MGRNLLAVASVAVPLSGGLALLLSRARRQLGAVLLALACCSLGFLWFNLFSDDTGIGSALVVALASVLGTVLLRHGAFLVSFAGGGALLIGAVVFNWQVEDDQWQRIPVALAIGCLLLAAVLGAVGFVLSRALAWSLAGLVGWAAAWWWFAAESGGEVAALLVAAAVAGLLLIAFVKIRRYALAVIGCLILLSVWPAALYQLVSSAYGVAIGLIAAGAVLITVVVVLSRRSVITVDRTSDQHL